MRLTLQLVLDPRYKLVWFKATGWSKQWIDNARKQVTELYKTKYLPVYSKKEANNDGQIKTTLTTDKTKPTLFSDLFAKQMSKFQKLATDDDLKRYLSDNVVDPDMLVKERTGINGVLGWWKVSFYFDGIKRRQNKIMKNFIFQIHEKEYPVVAAMAKDFLSASGTGIPVERLFSSGPDILQPKRQCLMAESIQRLVCLKSWIKASDSFLHELQDAFLYKLGIDKESTEC